jgi:type II secretory pathway pseudopilin PulG
MRRSQGVTLIELMVAILIVIMLASMVLFALQRAQVSARQARTQALVARLHSIIGRQWATYQTRRVPVDASSLAPALAAELSTKAKRVLIRMELPDRWSEVAAGNSGASVTVNAVNYQISPTAAARSYYRYYTSVSAGITGDDLPSTDYQNAECLYMIVTVGLPLEREMLGTFSEAEVGDVDGDGAKEFLDAWGKPIGFLRWPVGFVDFPAQDSTSYPFGHLSDLQPPRDSPSCRPDATENHDPLDPRQMDTYAFTVFPLIYSAGPDKTPDINTEPVDTSNPDDPYLDYRNDTAPCATYAPPATAKYVGIPADVDGDGELDHQDNIHNHFSEARVE